MHFLADLIGLATRLLLRQFFRIAPEWLDHRTDDPIMHERINRGSDRYFVWRERMAPIRSGRATTPPSLFACSSAIES